MFANFGSKVNHFKSQLRCFLPREDRDIADNIATILRDQGVDIILYRPMWSRSVTMKNQVQVHSEHAQLAVDALLIASGRQPATASLHPENAGIAVNERGQLSLTSDYIPPQTIFGRWEMLPAGCNLILHITG